MIEREREDKFSGREKEIFDYKEDIVRGDVTPLYFLLLKLIKRIIIFLPTTIWPTVSLLFSLLTQFRFS